MCNTFLVSFKIFICESMKVEHVDEVLMVNIFSIQDFICEMLKVERVDGKLV